MLANRFRSLRRAVRRAVPITSKPTDARVSSLDKMLVLLDLCTDARPIWSIEQAMRDTGYPRSTLYRYCRSLVRSGLLESAGQAGFGLGARIMDLDRTMRLGSPLIRAARSPMAALARQLHLAVLLGRAHAERLICLHDELPADEALSESRRGWGGSLVASGATGDVLLAWQPAAQLRRLHQRALESAPGTPLAARWDELRARLRTIRRAGWAAGEEPDLLGTGYRALAVPVLDGRRRLLATLTLSIPPDAVAAGEAARDRHLAMLRDTARQVAEALQATEG